MYFSLEQKNLFLTVIPVLHVEGFHCFDYNWLNAAARKTMFLAGKIHIHVFSLPYFLIDMLIWSNLEHWNA